jgi:Holliday junction DNA helicase RuvA subunit
MISTLTGTIRSLSSEKLIIEVGGVGLSVLINPQTSASVALGSQSTFYTSLVVREDSLTLFGFLTEEVRNLFELVQTVSGVGPKVALSIMGALTPEDLARAISQEDTSAIERVPGIGKKGAQRMILELKGKLSDLSSGGTGWRALKPPITPQNLAGEVPNHETRPVQPNLQPDPQTAHSGSAGPAECPLPHESDCRPEADSRLHRRSAGLPH